MAKRILIIDDDKVIADMMEQTLLEEGYSARKATQSLRTFDEVREFQPDLILLDLMMPYLDGSDQLQLFDLEKSTKDIPVIMITADLTAKEREAQYQNLGVRTVMLKPFNIHDFLRVVRDTVGAPGEEA